MNEPLLVMGIESSCDETAVGIVSSERRVLANLIASQIEIHRPYGGVVPEIAARAHLDKIDALVRAALEEASVSLEDLDAIAATCGPGLIGGVMVGEMMGKAMAAAKGLPFLAVNHLEAHALTARLTEDVQFPYLLLLVSGGHCQILLAKGVGDFVKLGGTLDDAIGECFDKGAKALGLGYPGGPKIEEAARTGDETAFDLPRPLVGRKGCDFSFSGLKTALRLKVEALQPNPPVADLAASFQAALADCVKDRMRHALALCEVRPTALVAGGGVAANQKIRAVLRGLAEERGLPFLAPPPALCTDNGVMVAWAGLEHFRLGERSSLACRARPRWEISR